MGYRRRRREGRSERDGFNTPAVYLLEPELGAAPPRPIRRRPGRGWLFGGVQFFLLPHTLVGIFLLFFTLHTLALILFGQFVPGWITGREIRPTSRNKEGYYYTVHYAYSVDGRRYTDKRTVSREAYERLEEGTRVEVKTLRLGPWSQAMLLLPGSSPWSRFLPIALIALFWDGILSFFVWLLYVLPLVYRWLVIYGQPAPGRVTERSKRTGRTTSYYLHYQFTPEGWQPVKSKMEVRREAWETTPKGALVTVLHSPRNPRWNVLYCFADYHVV
jgi:hypothetical protein